MSRTSVAERAAAIVSATTARVSEASAELIRRYAASVHLDGSPGTRENALVDLREFCRIVESANLTRFSYSALAALANSSAPSPTAARRRRRVIGRLIRLLQSSGELPTNAELTASDAIETIVAETLPGGRPTLRRWLAQRRRKVGWWMLRWEAKDLRDLESVIAAYPGADDGELITRWLFRLVRQIVDCGCAPISRSADHDVCACCGATTATHGSRPSPGEPNQRKLRALARRYLQFRRLPVPTSVA